jgi:hypothetical protein
MANLPDHPQSAPVCQHTHERVNHCHPGCPEQSPPELHHIANDQHHGPPDRGGDETEPPPPPEIRPNRMSVAITATPSATFPIIARNDQPATSMAAELLDRGS